MRPYPFATHLTVCLVVLALGAWGQQSLVIRRVMSYGAAMLVMVYVCSLGAVVVFGRIPAKGYLAAGLAFLGGGIIGILVGIPLGKLAVGTSWVYWLLIALVAGVIAWLKPLF